MAALESIGPTVVRGAESFLLKASQIDQTFQIDVLAPPGEIKAPLPVIYVTDASYGFGVGAQTLSLMQTSRELPRAILVGIGYPQSFDARTIRGLRFREFCPTEGREYVARIRREMPGEIPDSALPGGAGAFLSFITDELKPAIEARYPVDVKDQTHIGMSLGGLFALFALFRAPAAFQRVIALSPSIWWDERSLLGFEAAYAKDAKDLPVNLFTSIGALEEAAYPEAAMVSNLYAFDATLRGRKYPGLRMAMEVFPQETHNSVYGGSLSRGLRTVFGRAPGFESWAKLPG
jgi:predicted alpha/beta superfamily hydrolase